MCGVVIGDQVQRLALGSLPINLAQKLQLLERRVPPLALANDLAVKSVKRGEQGGRAVALVVVCHGCRVSGLHRQTGLSAVESLYLALLVAAQHQRVFGWGPIQADDIFALLNEQGVARHLTLLGPMRLQSVRFPNALDRGVAHRGHQCQRARAPLRRGFRFGLRRQTHDRERISLGLAPAARQVLLDALQSACGIACAPATHLHPTHAEHLANVVIIEPICG